MSFLSKYLDQARLEELAPKVKDHLSLLESLMEDDLSSANENFDECLKVFGPQIADVARRLGDVVRSFSVLSLAEAFNTLKLASKIGFEIYQIVRGVKDCVLPEGLSEEQSKAKQIKFGKDLAYFVWLTAAPLEGKLKWVPFKKKIEEGLVKWVAGAAIELAFDMDAKHGWFGKSSVDNFIKVI